MSQAVDAIVEAEPMSLAAAAEQLGVHYMTAYRYVRTGRMLAEKRAGQWWVTSEDLAVVLAEGTGARRRTEAQPGAPRQMMIEPFTTRLIAGDTAGCWDLITDALSGGASPVDVHTQLLAVALERIGQGWQRGEVSVSDEHRATATAYRLLGQMGPLFRHRGRRRGTIILGSIAGDPHAMPSAMLADLLADRRFDVVDLGANTPVDSFAEVARRCDDLVGVGVCAVLETLGEVARTQTEQLRAALPEVFLLAGGAAMTGDKHYVSNYVDIVTSTAQEACDAFENALLSAAAEV